MSTASHSNTAVLESEVLYLIAKFLKSSDKFEETFYKFSEELVRPSTNLLVLLQHLKPILNF